MKLAVTNLILSRRPVKLPNTILKSTLGLNSLWPNHTIKHLRSWSMQIQAMASCMTAPSHYLKQCGLIIKLINNVPWHLSQWIIIKYLKMPNSKMRLKLVCWDKFTPRPEIIHLFSSDNSFLHHGGNCPASRTTLVATRFRVAVICPIIQVPHCIRVFFYFVWFVFINHIFQFYYELCTYCNILDIYLS